MEARTVLGVLLTVCALSAGVRGQYEHTSRILDIIYRVIDNGFQRNMTRNLVDQFLEIYVPTSEAVQNERCRRDSMEYKEAAKENRGWALRMLDAGSKIPSGLWMGNAVELGNYDECLMVTSGGKETSSYTFQGQHCMVSVELPDEGYGFDEKADRLGEEGHLTTEATNSNARVNDTYIIGELTLLLGSKWSVCIPSSCTPGDLQAHLRSVLKDMIGGVEITVGEDACRSRAHPTVLTPADWFAVILLTFFGLLVAASTGYDLSHQESASRSALFVSFSVYTNGRKLLTLSPDSDDLLALHGIRTLSMLWILVGHSYGVIIFERPAVNGRLGLKIHESWNHALVTCYRLAVDSFLLLSGLLLCFGFFKERARGGTFNIVHHYLHRYIRLTPAYAVMILLTATLLDNSNEGPVWDEVVGAAQKNCQNYWWAGLLYVNNYVHPFQICMDQSWYLSLDMQLYLVSPLLLYPIWRWRRVSKYLLGLTIIAGICTGFTIGWINQFSVNPNANINTSEYLPFHARFTPWVMGIALGYYLHTTKNTTPNLSRRVVAGGWILCAALLISSVTANHVYSAQYFEYSRWAEALNSALDKPAWALGVAWIVFACSKGFGGFINTFLSCKIFQLLSRLTYSVYLVHYAFILWLTGSIKTPYYLADKTILTIFLNITVLSFVAAPILSLVFEVPALAIEKIFLGKNTPKEGKSTKYDVQNGGSKDNALGEELFEIIDSDASLKKQGET